LVGTGEFADQRRGQEIPAVTQIYHMQRSLAELQQDFGKQTLELKPGNNSWSKSQFNNTAGLAARVGFGLVHGDKDTYYPDRELVLDMADLVPDFNTGYDLLDVLHPERWPNHPDGPVILGFHDRDIALAGLPIPKLNRPPMVTPYNSYLRRIVTTVPTLRIIPRHGGYGFPIRCGNNSQPYIWNFR